MNQKTNETEKLRMFHVSRAESGIAHFRLLTHFGTLAAAKQRAKSVAMAGARLTLYEVDIHVGNALQVADLVDDVRGNNHSWVRLADTLRYDEKVISAHERDSVFVAGGAGGQNGEAGGARLAEVLRSKGFDSIVYENRFEDAGSKSVITLRENQVEIIAVAPLNDQQLS